jgi:hypothetical protein
MKDISLADKVVWSLFVALAAGCALLLLSMDAGEETPGRDSSGGPAATTTRTETTQSATPRETTEAQTPPAAAEDEQQEEEAPSQPAEDEPAAGGVQPCSQVPPVIREPVTCATKSSTLTIVTQRDPVLLGGTQARIIRASLAGSVVTVRVRVRNETDAEQGVAAGGQELYLNLAGLRVDPMPIGDERVPQDTGKTVDLRFRLTPAREERLRAAQGRGELGIRPWTEEAEEAGRVGVIRFQARLSPAAEAGG